MDEQAVAIAVRSIGLFMCIGSVFLAAVAGCEKRNQTRSEGGIRKMGGWKIVWKLQKLDSVISDPQVFSVIFF